MASTVRRRDGICSGSGASGSADSHEISSSFNSPSPINPSVPHLFPLGSGRVLRSVPVTRLTAHTNNNAMNSDTTAVSNNNNRPSPAPPQTITRRTVNGTISYTPSPSGSSPFDRRGPSGNSGSSGAATPAFPTPHIRPRQRRPHTIHIVSYPPGYVPAELRSSLCPPTKKTKKAKKPKQSKHHKAHKAQLQKKRSNPQFAKRHPPAASASSLHDSARIRLFGKLLSAFIAQSSTAPLPPPALPHQESETINSPWPRQVPTAREAPTNTAHTAPEVPASAPGSRRGSLQVFGRCLSRSLSRGSDQSHPLSHRLASSVSSLSAPPATPATAESATPAQAHQQPQLEIQPPTPQSHSAPVRPTSAQSTGNTTETNLLMTRNPVVVDALRPTMRSSSPHGSVMSGHSNHSNHSNRNSFMSVRSVKSIMTSSVSEITEKPVASGGGLACSILLAEPSVFLTGFEHDGHTQHSSDNGTALLRGKLQLNVSKNIKIRSVTLKLHGKARTEWPEGIPPLKIDVYEEESLRTQALTFFHAMHESWETPYGNQCTYTLKNAPDNSLSAALNRLNHPDNSATAGMTARDMKRLSLQQVQSRSFGKGDSPMAHTVAKGYKVFYPGTYEYSFELPIDHHQLETIKLPFGSVKWELETTVERAGAFKPNLHGSREVNIVRVPDQLSLETVEPISISRQWEDQLYYDIVISGKSFPIGSRIPIAFKLTPLAKVQLHKVKVFVTESAEYWTNNRKVTRKDPGRKILLLEKVAGKPLDKQYVHSDINVIRGGELSPSERAEARATASRRRDYEARRAHHTPEPLPQPTENLLGDLDLGLEAYWGATEMEMNVQLPTCEQMAKNPSLRLHPDCSWRNAHVYHWIKVVMRISRLDEDDPTGKRRRHFEISIDSPFTILNCLATQANTSLPQYSGTEATRSGRHRDNSNCGCPDAPQSESLDAFLPISPTDNVQHLPAMPEAAHLQRHVSPTSNVASDNTTGDATPTSNSQVHRAHSDREAHENPRPIHLLRVPSFAPPAFDEDESPPVPADVETPPPNYDAIVGTPSVDGLADYFSRLARFEHPNENAIGDDDSDSDSDSLTMPARISSRGGRVNVANPRTPGGRRGPSRSMDIERPIMPFHLSMANVLRRDAE